MIIAFLLNQFPAVSETFVLRQITGLIDLGQALDVYAEWPEAKVCDHPEVQRYDLLTRTRYLGLPPESGHYEMPVWPLNGRTWSPNSEKPVLNAVRLLRAAPKLIRCMAAYPGLTLEVLNHEEYGYQASSLSALYRLSALSAGPGGYDVLHAHFGPVGKTFRFARKLWRAPLVVSFHGYDFSTWPRHEGNSAYRSLFEVVDMVTVHSEYARERLVELGCPPCKLRRLPCGVDLEEFAFRPRTVEPGETVRILTVARLVEKKGLEYSIRAIARLQDRHPILRYDIIGDGPLRASLQKLIQELGLQESVFLHGAQNGAYVQRMIDGAHLFMLTSITAVDGDQEGTPVSLLEAQACGMPVVSSLHSGIPEIVMDGRSGFLVPEGDVDAISQKLAHLVQHSEIWPKMGENGRRFMEEHHDIDKLNQQLVRLYEEAITEYRASSHNR